MPLVFYEMVMPVARSAQSSLAYPMAKGRVNGGMLVPDY